MSTPMSLRLPSCTTAVTIGRLAALDSRPERQTGDTVVMVPGYTGSKEDFLLLLTHLTDAGHRVITYDQRGQYESSHDETSHDETSYELDVLAGDLLEVIGDGPAHVVGHSFGGLVSRLAAISDPSRFRSLTLLDSGPAGLTGMRALRIALLRPVLLERGKAGVWEYMTNDDLPPDVAAFVHRRFHANSHAGLLAMGNALVSEPDRTAELAATGLPLLVVHGVADDAWSPEEQTAMAERLGARHAVIAGAVHSPAVEQPDATARVLLEFWDAVERTA